MQGGIEREGGREGICLSFLCDDDKWDSPLGRKEGEMTMPRLSEQRCMYSNENELERDGDACVQVQVNSIRTVLSQGVQNRRSSWLQANSIPLMDDFGTPYLCT